MPNEKLNTVEFVDKTVGACIPKGYMPAIEKGLREAAAEGIVSGYPIGGVKMVLTDGEWMLVYAVLSVLPYLQYAWNHAQMHGWFTGLKLEHASYDSISDIHITFLVRFIVLRYM